MDSWSITYDELFVDVGSSRILGRLGDESLRLLLARVSYLYILHVILDPPDWIDPNLPCLPRTSFPGPRRLYL
jgi:hypothetical protein